MVSLTVPLIETWTWPWPIWTLHAAYLTSGLVIAAYYIPLLQRAWRHPVAAATAHSLLTWAVWTACRAVAFLYGIFVVHELVFLIVVGVDLIGRLAVAALIVRARGLALAPGRARIDTSEATPIPIISAAVESALPGLLPSDSQA